MEKGTKLLEGSIWKGVVAFAIPLFLGNLFQQLYNTVDSLIVGNFLGSDALAAVRAAGWRNVKCGSEWMTYCPDCYNEIHGAAADFTGVGR